MSLRLKRILRSRAKHTPATPESMPRKPTKSRNPVRGATPAGDYEIGDQAFFSFAGTAGEGLFIGQDRTLTELLQL